MIIIIIINYDYFYNNNLNIDIVFYWEGCRVPIREIITMPITTCIMPHCNSDDELLQILIN